MRIHADPISDPPDPGGLDPFEAWQARAEVLMEAAITAMEGIAADLIEPGEEPFPLERRRQACLDLCAKTFDRLTARQRGPTD